MEWVEGRITKRSVDAAEAPETRHAITELAYTGADKVHLPSAREKILELMYEIEALKRQHSGSHVENLQAELSVSYATNRGFQQQWEDEIEENEKLNAALKHEMEENEKLSTALNHEKQENEKLNAALKHDREDNEKLSTALNHEKQENEKLNAALKFALLENDNLIELTRSLREQADGLDGLRAILEIIVDQTVSSIVQDDNSEWKIT
jgi:DNA-binding transcriptional regulator GbsR (MarR family)